MKALLAPAALLPLAACATAPRTSEPTNACNPAPGQSFLGQKATPATGQSILAATGATRLRWVPPRTAVTMEYAYGRVTVSYDDDYAIRQVTCG